MVQTEQGTGSGKPAWWLALVACVALLAGAGGVGGCARSGRAEARARPAGTTEGNFTLLCPSGYSPPRVGPDGSYSPSPTPSHTPVPGDFVAASARRCIDGTITVQGEGEWLTNDEQEATSGLDALVRALRTSPPPPVGTGCRGALEIPAELVLTDTHGRTIRPQIPLDNCGFSLPELKQAIAAVPWKTIKQTRVRLLNSQVAIDSGCPQSFKAMVAIDTWQGEPPRRDTPVPLFTDKPPASMKVCRYKLDPESKQSANGSEVSDAGLLETAGTLTGESLTHLISAIDDAPRANARCDKPQPPFAMLAPTDRADPWVAVELGGCYRSVDDHDQLRQLDAATVALLMA